MADTVAADGEVERIAAVVLNELRDEAPAPAGYRPTRTSSESNIFRVAEFLRRRDKEAAYSTPELFSVGPYHHPELPHALHVGGTRKQMQRVKLQYLQDLTWRQRTPPDFLLNCLRVVGRRAEEAAAKYAVRVDIRRDLPLPDSAGEVDQFILDIDADVAARKPENKSSDTHGGGPAADCVGQASGRPEVISIRLQEFVKMMVLDGCFIIEFLIKWYLGEIESQAIILRAKPQAVRTDLLRLENQMPFFLLEAFFLEARLNDDDGQLPDLRTMALAYLSGDRHTAKRAAFVPYFKVHHLLHLYHTMCLEPENIKLIKGSAATKSLEVYVCGVAGRSLVGLPVLFLRLLLKPLSWLLFGISGLVREIYVWAFVLLYLAISDYPLHRCIITGGNRQRVLSDGIPTASYLRDTGFKFKNKDPLSKFSYVTRNRMTIEIPALSSDLTSFDLLKNLIALERCPLPLNIVVHSEKQRQLNLIRVHAQVIRAALTFQKASSMDRSLPRRTEIDRETKITQPFTAFAMLMGRLLGTPKDVAVLKKLGVIDKRFGSDEKIVSFFRDLCTDILLDPGDNYLQVPLLDHVARYYEKDYLVKFYLWRNRLVPDYFSNPWAMPSMITALIALGLSLIATFFTVYPYYNPRPPN